MNHFKVMDNDDFAYSYKSHKEQITNAIYNNEDVEEIGELLDMLKSHAVDISIDKHKEDNPHDDDDRACDDYLNS